MPQIDTGAAITRQERILDLQLDWIRAIDAKMPILMAFATAMLAVLAAVTPEQEKISAATCAWVAVGGAALVTSLIFCAAATFPQTEGPRGSLIYFGGIGSMGPAEYGAAVASRSDEQHLADLVAQCHRNACIALGKYAHTRRAFIALFAGLAPWLWSIYRLYQE